MVFFFLAESVGQYTPVTRLKEKFTYDNKHYVNICRDARKPVFVVSDGVKLKPTCSATETS